MAFTTLPGAGVTLTASTLSALVTELRPSFVRKGADETVNNSAALQNDDALSLAVVADAVYRMWLRLIVNSGTTPDIKQGFTYPTGTTMTTEFFTGSTPDTAASVLQGPGTEATVAAFSCVAADQIIRVEGLVTVSSTAGTLQVQWAQNTATVSNTVVKAGSFLHLHRVS